ncbi:hypothetical protein Meth11DRAFT_1774 [Methylophilaceae bacterium 11]|uniref:hypothetical protein n=2 Tax=unclassified Methylotenera TaxID=2643294 RepID=UPI00035E893B|nr:hypothetical protein [Methylotenera sp. 1P/1]EUJ10943.1 hypothetical protein Meth11DRAFT_1774 [Methylophilaceae bacterium 11]
MNLKHRLIRKRNKYLLLLMLIINTFSITSAFAQQSLFNVPSVETTEKNKYFFQEQVDLFSKGVANTTLDYGLGQGWETGLTIPGVNFYSGDQADPMLLVNVQKGFYVNESWKVGVGTQTGYTVPFHDSSTEFATFNYWNNAFDLNDWGKYYLGVYSANKAITGNSANTNFLAGVELPFTQNVHIMADYIGGKNDIGATAIGLVWYASKKWQFSAGGQFSNDHHSKDAFQGAIVEFTFVEQ